MQLPINIAGGGLTGLALGIALKQQGAAQVVIHEAGTYPRHRVCGEFICGVEKGTLTRLGIADLLSEALQPKTLAWYADNEEVRQDLIPTEAYSISRYALDQKLVDRFCSLGGHLKTGVRIRPENRAQWIDCTGRQPKSTSPWLGLKCHLRSIDLKADLEMHVAAEGYIGINQVESGHFNVCGLFKKQGNRCLNRKEPLLMQYARRVFGTELAARLASSPIIKGSECAVSALDYSNPTTPGTDGSICLGDANGLIPPFTGNGMSIAFESADLALDPLLMFANRKTTWTQAANKIATLQHSRLSKRVYLAQKLHPWVTNRRRLTATTRLARLPIFPFKALFRATH